MADIYPGKEAEREAWIKNEIARIKTGGTIRQRCLMATTDRIDLGLCLGDIPEDRAHRGAHTCSNECQNDRRRLLRWEQAKGSCRYCGHGLSKKERDAIRAAQDHHRKKEEETSHGPSEGV